MEITEAKLFEALGVDPGEGAKEQEVTEPAAEEETGAEAVGEAETDGEQSPEERHANAARRRAEEKQKAIDEAVAKTKAEYAERERRVITKLQLKDPETDENVDSLEGIEKWHSSFEDRKFDREFETGNPSREAVAAEVRKQLEAEHAAAAKKEADERLVSEDLAKITALDPEIRTVGDLLAMENADEFRRHVERGASFYDAFRLANYEKLTAASAKAAEDAAKANARSKDHLVPTKTRGKGAPSVPSDEMEMFRLFNPKASDDEIEKYYQKSHERK